MEKLYIVLMIGAIIASIFTARVLIWAFVDVRKNNEPESIQVVIGIGALLVIFEIVFFIWEVIL